MEKFIDFILINFAPLTVLVVIVAGIFQTDDTTALFIVSAIISLNLLQITKP